MLLKWQSVKNSECKLNFCIVEFVCCPFDFKNSFGCIFRLEIFFAAARNTRLLITYSNDNKKHIMQVVKFAQYLRKQGFRVTIDSDAKERELIAEDIHGWLDTRFSQVNSSITYKPLVISTRAIHLKRYLTC